MKAFQNGDLVRNKLTGGKDIVVSVPGMKAYDKTSDDALGFILKERGWSFQENWVADAMKAKKTSTKRKTIMKEAGIPPKKRGRPAGSKKMDKLEKINSKIRKSTHELIALYPAKEYLEDQVGVDNDPGIDVPLHVRGGHFKWNFEKTRTMPWYDKVTWVLTAVNVAILSYLIIKNLN